jgi:hypothetical protein
MAMLKNELLMLKCKCLEHSDCDCEAIRDYLKNTITTTPPANAALYSGIDDKSLSDDIAKEIARKQSSASAFDLDAMSTPEDSMSQHSNSEDSDAGLMMFKSELQAVAND